MQSCTHSLQAWFAFLTTFYQGKSIVHKHGVVTYIEYMPLNTPAIGSVRWQTLRFVVQSSRSETQWVGGREIKDV